jgi:hypothetical protein
MKSTNLTKNVQNTDHGFQGRSQKHVQENNKAAWMAVLLMVIITVLAALVTKCQAQDTGYRWCISNSAGFRCDNTTQLQVALDSITPVCSTPKTVITTCLQKSRYYLSETEVFTVYIEEKRIVGYKKNGQPKLRKLKHQKS